MTTVAETWDRIHAWFKGNAPEILGMLNPGASEEKIKELEESLQVNDLPEDFKESYRIHDGSSAHVHAHNMEHPGRFFGTALNSHTFDTIEDIVKAWSENKEVVDQVELGPFELENGDPLEFQCQWWNPRWIPFGTDYAASIAIDLAPTEAGTYGQVFQWHRRGEVCQLLARSFSEFLSQFSDDLDHDKYRVVDDGSHRLVLKENENNEENNNYLISSMIAPF